MDDDDDLPDATPDRDYDTLAEYPFARPPVARPKVPSVMPPPGACDAHLHVMGGAADFALAPGRAENPAPGMGYDDWLDLLRTHLDTLGMGRAVIVHSILYGDDNGVTVETLRRLGGNFRGIGLLRDGAREDRIEELRVRGIVGLRLNYVHGGVLTWEGAQAMAPQLAARDMHIQMLMHAHLHMADLEDAVRACPVPVVFDHIGWPDPAAGVDQPGFAALRRLMAEGHAWVKLSGLYRVADAPWTATDDFVAALVAANPERCLWGSDWPHIMLNGTAMPDAGRLMDRFMDTVTGSADRQRILVDNPAALYGF